MASLLNKTPAETYKDLLTVSSASSNQGLESSLKSVFDGEGVESAIQLSTTHLKIPSGKTLEIAGTLNSVNATLTGDLLVGDDLTVTDLITSDSLQIGGGYGSTGCTITTNGDINTDGGVNSTSRIIADNMVIGGGFGSTGCTIGTDGSVLSNSRVACDNLVVGGGFGDTGLSIDTNGRIDTDEIIVCQAVKTTTGVVSSSASNSPKVKLDTATQVSLTVVDSGADKEILKVKNDGETTIKDSSNDTKFTVKNDGRIGFKPKTTTELNAISASTGDMAFDNTLGVFKIWRP
tara:strand:- start:308 stop:1180 length:873 start_codon:yes stop_codon:yes gene_type:complete